MVKRKSLRKKSRKQSYKKRSYKKKLRKRSSKKKKSKRLSKTRRYRRKKNQKGGTFLIDTLQKKLRIQEKQLNPIRKEIKTCWKDKCATEFGDNYSEAREDELLRTEAQQCLKKKCENIVQSAMPLLKQRIITRNQLKNLLYLERASRRKSVAQRK
tara:strand:- start:25 stop:492 length:468 start_codon:yes stop_codon:yes gene_type:complete